MLNIVVERCFVAKYSPREMDVSKYSPRERWLLLNIVLKSFIAKCSPRKMFYC